MLNSPANPTGAAYSADDHAPLIEVLAGAPHVWLVSDDIYEHTVYDAFVFVAPPQLARWLQARCLVVNGLSKADAMTGWRIGQGPGLRALRRSPMVARAARSLLAASPRARFATTYAGSHLMAVCMALPGVVILLHRLADIGFTAASVIVLPGVALIWIILLRAPHYPVLNDLTGALSGLTSPRTEGTTFLSVNLVGATLSILLGHMAFPGLLAAATIPMLPLLLACLTIVPLTAAACGVPSHVVAHRWNAPFAAALTVMGAVAVTLLMRWPH